MRVKYLALILACLALANVQAGDKKPVKVACIGNSITYGTGITDREQNAYPVQLQRLLGDNYIVGNFGKPGATLLRKGHRPYMEQTEFRQAMEFAGDIAVIHLGINDTDPRDWPHYQADFVGDYLALIDSLKAANRKCRIIMARMTPIADRHPRFETQGTRDWHGEIQAKIEEIARMAKVQLIDFHQPLYPYPYILTDAVHPNNEGAAILARTVYEGITGKVGGLQLPAIYADNMVLQHGCKLRIHGKADAGTRVRITIGKQRKSARADLNGNWEATLNPLKAGGPYTLKIVAGKETKAYKNVLAGEVWLCSGQSNMAFRLRDCVTAKKDIPQAANGNIRLFDMRPRWYTNAVAWDASVLDSLNHLQYYQDTQWEECTPQSAARFSAIAYYFGKMLQDSLQVPVGLICNSVGGSPAEAWIDRRSLEYHYPAILRNWTENELIQDWVRERASLNIKKSTNKLQRHPYSPCYLYEAGILPLAQYPIKGVIWYQGESNAHNKEAHEKLFKLLVNSWRKEWNNEELPFYFVQLSSIDRSTWADFRDSQRRLIEAIPHTGMVVSSDKGDSLDVHPRQKKEIGERLAVWTLNKSYGRKDITPSGPLFKAATFSEGAAIVEFEYGKGMRTSDGKAMRSFEVAGKDGKFYPAQAEAMGDNRLKVWSDKVKQPQTVRYGWQPFTRANLVNEDGLPASTFSSEE